MDNEKVLVKKVELKTLKKYTEIQVWTSNDISIHLTNGECRVNNTQDLTPLEIEFNDFEVIDDIIYFYIIKDKNIESYLDLLDRYKHETTELNKAIMTIYNYIRINNITQKYVELKLLLEKSGVNIR